MEFPIGGILRKLRQSRCDSGSDGKSPDERNEVFELNNVSKRTSSLTKMGVLAAVSIVLVAVIHVPIIPAVSFLEYDPADIPILLGTFALGPVAGLVLTVIVSVIQGMTVSAASSWYGIVMHIIATGAYVIIAGNIYARKKTKMNAIIALVCGTLAMAVVMIPANLALTPVYLQMVGVPAEAALPTVKGLLGWIILFNVIKAGINSVVTFLVYKRVSGLLHR